MDIQNDSTIEERISKFLTFLCFLIILIIFLHLPVYSFYATNKSKKIKEKTRIPLKPKWLTNNLPEFRKESFGILCIYQKDFNQKSLIRRSFNRISAWIQIVKLLRNFNFDPVENDTCIISIPRGIFKNGENPGEFILEDDENENGYFEYQMIGDDRIQVAYFVVGGVSYVAGICIYIENPDENGLHYNIKIIEKLMKKEEYYGSKDGIFMEIYHRIRTKEPLLITKNQYSIGKHWKLNGEKRIFESITPIHSTGYLLNPDPDSPKKMKIQYCFSRNDFVMLSEKNGIQMHSFWNKTRKRIEYLKCDTCNESDHSRPPLYQNSIQ